MLTKTAFNALTTSILSLSLALTAGCGPEVTPDEDAGISEPEFEAFGHGQLVMGTGYGCRINDVGDIRCWGDVQPDVTAFGEGPFEQISALFLEMCARRVDGTYVCDEGGFDDPMLGITTVKDVAAGAYAACVVEPNEEASCWGSNLDVVLDGAITSSVKDIELTNRFGCAIRSDDTLGCWGEQVMDERLNPPDGEFLQFALSGLHGCGILKSGEVSCWGRSNSGQLNAPTGQFTSVSAGQAHSCGIRAGNGAIECWGANDLGQTSSPPGFYTAIGTVDNSNCAIRSDGSVLCWGEDLSGNTQP